MWTAEMKASKEWSSQLWAQFMQLGKRSLKKIQDFNGIWTRYLAIPVRCSDQLSYEATDVGSRPIMCSNLPVKEMKCDKCIWNKSYMWTAETKSSEEWSSQLWAQFMQLRKRSLKKKFRTSTGFEFFPYKLLRSVAYKVQENMTWHSFLTSLAWHKEQILKCSVVQGTVYLNVSIRSRWFPRRNLLIADLWRGLFIASGNSVLLVSVLKVV